jgi:hypothetical protein
MPGQRFAGQRRACGQPGAPHRHRRRFPRPVPHCAWRPPPAPPAAGRDLLPTHVTTDQPGWRHGTFLWAAAIASRQVNAGLAGGGTQDETDLTKKNARTFRKQLAPLRRARPPGRAKAAPPAYLLHPAAQRRHPGLGQPAGHRGQRPRAHPDQRGRAVPRRGRGIRTDLGDRRGAGLPRHRRWRRPRRSCYRADAAAGAPACLPPGRPATWRQRPEGTSAATADRPPGT